MSIAPRIDIVDDLTPEDLAMLQALYSRSAESHKVHLRKVHETGSGKFMSRHYIGYNHKSIADCGTTTLFFENVSLLAAKAIQDWPLYSGQETSTRYIDMSRQHIVDPVGTPASRAILDRWMDFYKGSNAAVAEEVRRRHPRAPSEAEDVYERAVTARTFDILRGFLPAGITTQLSWHTNLRQAIEHLQGMLGHLALEVRVLAADALAHLAARYPSTFGAKESVAAVSSVTGGAAERDAWLARVTKEIFWRNLALAVDLVDFHTTIPPFISGDALYTRPRGAVLPHEYSAIGQISFAFPLDFGSFRDIQRHRNGVCVMPVLTTTGGFEPWYIDQLPSSVAAAADALLHEQSAAIAGLTSDPIERQYYIALGYRVPVRVTYGLPAALYVMELRSGKTIHPTLRHAVRKYMVAPFRAALPNVPVHADDSDDDWTIRRGDQTITDKAVGS